MKFIHKRVHLQRQASQPVERRKDALERLQIIKNREQYKQQLLRRAKTSNPDEFRYNLYRSKLVGSKVVILDKEEKTEKSTIVRLNRVKAEMARRKPQSDVFPDSSSFGHIKFEEEEESE